MRAMRWLTLAVILAAFGESYVMI